MDRRSHGETASLSLEPWPDAPRHPGGDVRESDPLPPRRSANTLAYVMRYRFTLNTVNEGWSTMGIGQSTFRDFNSNQRVSLRLEYLNITSWDGLCEYKLGLSRNRSVDAVGSDHPTCQMK